MSVLVYSFQIFLTNCETLTFENDYIFKCARYDITSNNETFIPFYAFCPKSNATVN